MSNAAKNLETLALFIDLDVKTAIQAAIVTLDPALRFARQRDLFAMNPANTLPHRAMMALEEQSIVRVTEALGRDAGLLPESTELRRKADLVCHRDAISHSYTVRWRRREMQTFFDADRQWTDRRVALVWDMWRSLNERLVEIGKPQRDMAVSMSSQHAAMVHLILRSSVNTQAEIPSEQSILEHLQRFRDNFLDLLVEQPDGGSGRRVPPASSNA